MALNVTESTDTVIDMQEFEMTEDLQTMEKAKTEKTQHAAAVENGGDVNEDISSLVISPFIYTNSRKA